MDKCEDEVERYREHLVRPLWELHEATDLLSGTVDFAFAIPFLDSRMVKSFKSGSYCMCGFQGDSLAELNERLLESLFDGIQAQELNAQVIDRPSWSEYHPEGKKLSMLRRLTFLAPPLEWLAFAVTEGFLLPLALQAASDLRQTVKPTDTRKSGWINETKTQALAQVLWYYYPKESIAGVIRRMFSLKDKYRKRATRRGSSSVHSFKTAKRDGRSAVHQKCERKACALFEFIPGQCVESKTDRARRVVHKVRPVENGLPMIPGLVLEEGGTVSFDFRSLKVALEVIGDCLLLKERVLTSQTLLDHPLIRMYVLKGGPAVDYVVKFCLRRKLERLQEQEYYSKTAAFQSLD